MTHFTPKEARAAISLLIRAGGLLATTRMEQAQGRPSLLCTAITRSLETQAEYDVESKLKLLIKHRLCGAVSLREWLAHRGFHTGDHDDYARVQETRVRWVKALIEEFDGMKGKDNEQAGSRNNVPRRKRRPRNIDWRGDRTWE